MVDPNLLYGAEDPRARTLVTLDGPAGVGKSTTARAVARELGYRYLDSGALYRAVTFGLLESGIPESSWAELTSDTLATLGLSVRPGPETVEILRGEELLGPQLRTPEVTARVSQVAAISAVRAWLLDAQRAAASQGRLVSDGRDMGTEVFPQAWCKVFLDADPRERARRRLGDQGVPDPDENQVDGEVARLTERDRKDREREASPLRIPEGALLVNTTDLTFSEQVRRIADHARSVRDGTEPNVD